MTWARVPVLAVVLVLAGCSTAAPGPDGPAPTGGRPGFEITGTVTASPAGPGPQRGTASPGTPLAGAVVILTAGGAPVARTTTDEHGRFRLLAAAGEYRITAVNVGIGSQAGRQITVTGPVEVNLTVDSGLR
jgi:hypothetical protein